MVFIYTDLATYISLPNKNGEAHKSAENVKNHKGNEMWTHIGHTSYIVLKLRYKIASNIVGS